MTLTDGIDLSFWNDAPSRADDDIDFDRVWNAGKRFVYFRATQAEHYIDPQFLNFVVRASSTPLRLGAYTFVDVDDNPKDDVDAFLRATEHVASKLALAPMYDLEKRSQGMGANQIVDYTCGWAQHYIDARAGGMILYSYAAFLKLLVRELGGPKSAGAQALVQYPLAIAQYTRGAPNIDGLPWSQPTIHQWAASDPNGPLGTCDGIKGYVDLDRFYGAEDELSWISCRN